MTIQKRVTAVEVTSRNNKETTGVRYACGFHMPAKPLDRLLTHLEECRYRFGRGDGGRVVSLLTALNKQRFPDAKSLIRFHETLMFLRAFPQNPSVVRGTESLLNTFWKRVEALRQSGADTDEFDPLEVSGIAGTQMSDTLSFDVARWLVRRLPGKVEIAWDEWDEGRAMGAVLPRFLPLLEDDALVEADTPWRRWVEAACPQGLKPSRNVSFNGTAEAVPFHQNRPGGAAKSRAPSNQAEWLIRQFEALPVSDRERAELYDSLRVPLRWDLGNSRVTRTRNWEIPRKLLYHDGPLIPRNQVSLAEELAKRPPELVKLSRRDGERIIDKIREVMLVRYRELYGTTLGDPASVRRADIGRGMLIYLWNLPAERRLPLRAYTAGLTLKNGVAINYIEAIGLCEWMEVGFNTFYTFRGGEAGWVYAQVLRCLTHLMGTTCVSVYPYQLGQDNDEAIESGAFWFYRKLGFRPGQEQLLRLVEREERKIAASRAGTSKALTTGDTEGHGGVQNKTAEYRTPARILKRLAAGHVFYEMPGSEVGAWDQFSTRNIGLRVSERMARKFGGDAGRMREATSRSVARILRVNPPSWTALERTSFENFALALDLIPDLSSWTPDEKQALVRIIRAKTKRDEMFYLQLMQRHARLRKGLLKLGS